MPASYCVENAKSNRSSCKQCKTKIDAGDLRIGTITPGPGDYDLTAWRHLACQKMPKGVSQVDDFAGFASLSSEDQKKVEEWVAGGASGSGGGKKRSAAELEEVAKMNPKKMKGKELDAALKDAGLSVKGKAEKQEAMNEVVERAAIEARYSKMTLPELKGMLELNKQVKGGTKPEVLERCVDGKMYGALPRCPQCGGGILKVVYKEKFGHGGAGKFSCPGYFDDDVFKRCSYKADTADRLPWQE